MAMYALSDIHGELELWTQIKNFLTKDDTLIFLGDAVDRGDFGLTILQDMLNDDRVVFLRGNHEQNIIEIFLDPDDREFLQGWFVDGGLSTWMEFSWWPHEKQVNLYQRLQRLPLYATYINKAGIKIILSHSGFTPGKECEDDSLNQIDLLNKYIYNRKHLKKDWVECEFDLLVHGHTPTGLMDKKYSGKVYSYCNNRKINIDIGATFLGVAALLDLDTLTPTYFYKKELLKGDR